MDKVLIIEDDELIAKLEQDYLEAHGFSTEIEQNGISGLKMALSEEFQAVLLTGFERSWNRIRLTLN